MTLKIADASVDLLVGDTWTINMCVVDVDGDPADDAIVVTVTDPEGNESTPAVALADPSVTGSYTTGVVVDVPGRWVAVAAGALFGAAAATAYAADAVDAEGMPNVDALDAYLGTHSFTGDELQGALDAEASAQRRACRVPAVYPPDLREALLRRCARNLALRRLPLAMLVGDADRDSSRVPGRDIEVRRLEAGYRRLKVG